MATKTSSTKASSKLPPYPLLRAAYVARVEREAGLPVDLGEVCKAFGLRSTDAVRKAAKKALDLCVGKTCWFCHKTYATPLKVKGDPDWGAIPLCACLNDLRIGVVWHPLQDGAGVFFGNGGPEALARLRKGVMRRPNEPGYIPADTPVVSRSCDAPKDSGVCRERFTLTAGMYKSAADSTLGQAAARDAKQQAVRTEMQRLGDFKHSTKCRACRDAWRDRAAVLRPRKEKTFAQMVLDAGLLKELV